MTANLDVIAATVMQILRLFHGAVNGCEAQEGGGQIRGPVKLEGGGQMQMRV